MTQKDAGHVMNTSVAHEAYGFTGERHPAAAQVDALPGEGNAAAAQADVVARQADAVAGEVHPVVGHAETDGARMQKGGRRATGDEAVDQVLGQLDALTDQSLDLQIEAGERVYRVLQGRLADLGHA